MPSISRCVDRFIRRESECPRAGRNDGQRDDQQRPAEPRRADKAGQHLERLAEHLAIKHLHATADHQHVVRKVRHQVGRADVLDPPLVEFERLAIVDPAHVHHRPVGHPRDQHGADDEQDTLEQRNDEQESNRPGESRKGR
jgi:hypothetical protein